jgi:hypothetical protein
MVSPIFRQLEAPRPAALGFGLNKLDWMRKAVFAYFWSASRNPRVRRIYSRISVHVHVRGETCGNFIWSRRPSLAQTDADSALGSRFITFGAVPRTLRLVHPKDIRLFRAACYALHSSDLACLYRRCFGAGRPSRQHRSRSPRVSFCVPQGHLSVSELLLTGAFSREQDHKTLTGAAFLACDHLCFGQEGHWLQ